MIYFRKSTTFIRMTDTYTYFTDVLIFILPQRSGLTNPFCWQKLEHCSTEVDDGRVSQLFATPARLIVFLPSELLRLFVPPNSPFPFYMFINVYLIISFLTTGAPTNNPHYSGIFFKNFQCPPRYYTFYNRAKPKYPQ